MITVNIDEAKTRLEELLEKALNGETIEIVSANSRAKLVAFPIAEDKFATLHEPKLGPRSLGTAKGQIWIADDFDAPIEDFKDYM